MKTLTTIEQGLMREAGQLAAHTLGWIAQHVVAGVTTESLDDMIREYTIKSGATPSTLGYQGYPKSCCISVNDVVCHGIPGSYVLKEGDVVNVDITSNLNGYHGDTSATFFVGSVNPDARRVVEVARQALQVGIDVVKHNARLGDIGAAIQEYVEKQGLSVVRNYGGHGIGTSMHMPPHIAHVGTKGAGQLLKEGMCITIEPMVNLGLPDVRTLEDNWTVVTVDGSLSAQFEHTLLITRSGCDVLTKRYAPLQNSEIGQ